jgi:AhpD family alkylhydroperoxidase
MQNFPNHTIATSPAGAQPLLQGAQEKFGMIPNLFAKMATAPTLLQGYIQIADLFSQSSLTPTEQQIVLLTTSRFNGCEYCMGAHSALASMGGVDAEVVNAIRNDQPISDPKLEALRQFAHRITEMRGWVDPARVQLFLEAGYTPSNVLEVVLGVGQKTLSNYTNHLVNTQLDAVFAKHAWKEPD